MPAPRKDRELFLKLAPRLKALIAFHRTPYEELAGLLNCNLTFISHLIAGRKILPAKKLAPLAALLKVTPDQLLGKAPIKKTRTLKLNLP
jgi:transcriptional regulator with XRE-family HTH domain